MLMDWDRAIERNSEALRRIIASLFAMAGLTSPLRGGRPSSDGRVGVIGETEPDASHFAGDPDCPAISPAFSADDRANGSIGRSASKPHQGEVERPATLPRYLHTAVLRILRPAESAMRRLIVVASRGFVVTLPPPRPRKEPKPVPVETTLRSLGIAVTLSPADLARAAAARRAADARAARIARPRVKNLPLLVPLKNHFGPRRKFVPPHLAPRVSAPGSGERSALPPPPSQDDPVDATRIGQRLTTLAAALDDLPGQAKRFARWTARRDRALAEERNRAAALAEEKSRAATAGQKPAHPLPYRRRRPVRIWPLRSGRPPGQGPRRGRTSRHEVHQILSDLHNLAFDVLEGLDTS